MISLQYAIYYCERDIKGKRPTVESKSEEILKKHHLHVKIKPGKKVTKEECGERKKYLEWTSHVRKYGSDVGM